MYFDYLCGMEIEKTDFIFTNDFREACSPKYKDYCLHLVCTSGSSQFMIGDDLFNFVKSSAMVKSSGKPVTDIVCSDDFHIIGLLISWRYLNSNTPRTSYAPIGMLQTMQDPIIPLNSIQYRQVLHNFAEIRARIQTPYHMFFAEVVRSEVAIMIFDFYSIQAPQRNSETSGRGQAANILGRFVNLLQQGLVRENRRVEYYASLLYISPKYLSEACIAASGRNASYWIERFTVNFLGHDIRETEKTFQQLSDEYHFSSISYFSRYVKSHMKMTPSEYRNTAPEK